MSEAKPSLWLTQRAEALSLANKNTWLASQQFTAMSNSHCAQHPQSHNAKRTWIVELPTCQKAADTYNEEPGTTSHDLNLAFLPAG